MDKQDILKFVKRYNIKQKIIDVLFDGFDNFNDYFKYGNSLTVKRTKNESTYKTKNAEGIEQ